MLISEVDIKIFRTYFRLNIFFFTVPCLFPKVLVICLKAFFFYFSENADEFTGAQNPTALRYKAKPEVYVPHILMEHTLVSGSHSDLRKVILKCFAKQNTINHQS